MGSYSFDSYQMDSHDSVQPIASKVDRIMLYALGLNGETGEIADRIVKCHKDNGGYIDSNAVMDLMFEIGDVMWYMSQLASELGITLETCAENNISKLKERYARQISSVGG